MNWYSEFIEEPIRSIVRLLRDNGFNTECSCGHEMYVQCQYILDGEFKRLHDLIYTDLHEKRLPIDFRIVIEHKVREGHLYTSLTIYFNEDTP